MRNRKIEPIRPQSNILNSSDIYSQSHRSQMTNLRSVLRDKSREVVRDRKKSLRKIRCDRIMGMLDFKPQLTNPTPF